MDNILGWVTINFNMDGKTNITPEYLKVIIASIEEERLKIAEEEQIRIEEEIIILNNNIKEVTRTNKLNKI